MKRLVLGLSLALAFGFVVSPVLAADSPQAARMLGAADRAFLASLAPSPAAKPMARRPAIGQEKALCFAGASCGSYSITCTGNSSTTSCSAADRNCPYERGHVTCDGATTWCNEICPGSGPPTCEQRESQCAWNCYPCDYDFSCDPDTPYNWYCHCNFGTCPV